MTVRTVEGSLNVPGDARFAVVAARFNELIVERLSEGALDTLRRHGVPDERIEHVKVPGSWELPVAARQIAAHGRASAIIALGVVIRGDTAHFEHVAGGCASGLMQVGAEHGLPVAFGVLTVDTMEQALDRAGGKAGNKGADAAGSALEMVSLMQQRAH